MASRTGAKMDQQKTPTRHRKGVYRVRFLCPNQEDSQKMALRSCRYWPMVHAVDERGRKTQIVSIRPAKVPQLILTKRYMATDIKINLYHSAITGPFNYWNVKEHGNKYFKIPHEQWAILVAKANAFQVDVSNIDKVVPLPNADIPNTT
mmetsp:Transcript_2602/g.3883  ORF Transcript_2602/g.3883 Transcript_2602/m.3883 type:complete len:149 (-) Transcript_2602:281-727(-)